VGVNGVGVEAIFVEEEDAGAEEEEQGGEAGGNAEAGDDGCGSRKEAERFLSAQADVHAGTETDFRAELPAITVPTLIIHGDAEVSAPIEQGGRRTAQLIPGSQFKLYEGAPHGLMFTHMDRLNADLLAFICPV
jgi:pimeloyl-ACP methyl ester carboxylesterase